MDGTAPKKEKFKFPIEYLMEPFERDEGVPDVTLDQLQERCSDDKEFLIGCKGRIFDVSENEMYGKDGGYNLFVGKDASVALSKMKFNKEFMDPSQLHWKKDIDLEELNILEDWLIKFNGKYPVVGYIKEDGLKRQTQLKSESFVNTKKEKDD